MGATKKAMLEEMWKETEAQEKAQRLKDEEEERAEAIREDQMIENDIQRQLEEQEDERLLEEQIEEDIQRQEEEEGCRSRQAGVCMGLVLYRSFANGYGFCKKCTKRDAIRSCL